MSSEAVTDELYNIDGSHTGLAEAEIGSGNQKQVTKQSVEAELAVASAEADVTHEPVHATLK